MMTGILAGGIAEGSYVTPVVAIDGIARIRGEDPRQTVKGYTDLLSKYRGDKINGVPVDSGNLDKMVKDKFGMTWNVATKSYWQPPKP